MQTKRLWQLFGALFLSLFLSAGYFLLPQSIFSLDERLRDFLFVLRGPIPHSDQVVIVDIDEKSLFEFGRWPWPRDRIAALVENLSSCGAGVVGMDMIFPEADHTSPHLLAQTMGLTAPNLKNHDRILADTIARSRVVGGYLFLFEPAPQTPSLLPASVMIERGKRGNDAIPQAQSALLNIGMLQDAFPQSGFLNNLPDSDGVIRTVPLLIRYGSELHLSLALEMIHLYYGLDHVEVFNSAWGVEGVALAERFIPTGRFGEFAINFRGGMKHFRYISASDVINRRVDPDLLKNKFVLIGTSAIGLGDVHAIPYDHAIPGVEVHANIIDNMITGDFIAAPIERSLYDVAMIVLSAILSVFLFSMMPRLWIAPGVVGLFILYYFLISWLLFDLGVILNLLFVIVALILGVMLALLIDYFYEARQKERAEDTVKETTATMLEQSRSAAMGEMVGMIAHQWRQPLSSMSAISSKVKLKGQLGKLDTVEKDMDEVVDLTRYLSETIEDFRNFFKEDKSFEVTPLESVVERSVRFTSHLLKMKEVTVTKSLGGLSARLNVNEMTQVLINLIKNAVDAYEARGIKDRVLHFEAEQKETFVTLHVSDRAGGLEEEKLAMIFEKHFSTKGAEGTGLGLYMCKKIIEENHHGSLHVSNHEGGLRFSICLTGE